MKKAIVFVLASTLMLSGCSTTPAQNASATAQPKETVYLLAGRVDAGEKADLTSRISARIATMNVNIGDHVTEGQVLATLDTTDLIAQVKVSEAAYQVAQANYEKVKKGARPEQIRQVEASLASAKSGYETLHRNFLRTKELFNAGSYSQSQLDMALSQDETAKAQYNSLVEQLSILKKGETKEGLAVLSDQVKQAAAAVEVANANLSNSTILSPIAGVVSAKNLNKGELASTSAVILTVTNSSMPTVVTYAPATAVSHFKTGQVVQVKVSDLSNKVFTGKVTVINTVVDSKSKGIMVKVAITNGTADLKPGMFAEIGLEQ